MNFVAKQNASSGRRAGAWWALTATVSTRSTATLSTSRRECRPARCSAPPPSPPSSAARPRLQGRRWRRRGRGCASSRAAGRRRGPQGPGVDAGLLGHVCAASAAGPSLSAPVACAGGGGQGAPGGAAMSKNSVGTVAGSDWLSAGLKNCWLISKQSCFKTVLFRDDRDPRPPFPPPLRPSEY